MPGALRIHYELNYIGKVFKAAKRSVTFKFAFEGDSDEHSVVVKHTLNSGKKVVFLNGSEIFSEEKVRAGQGGVQGCYAPPHPKPPLTFPPAPPAPLVFPAVGGPVHLPVPGAGPPRQHAPSHDRD